MRETQFEWDERNLDHIARHDVDPDEAEAVLDANPLLLRTSDDKYLAYGQTEDGRFLLVVFVRKPRQFVRVITSRDMSEDEKKQYHRRRK